MRIDFLKGPKSDKQYHDIDFYRKGGMGEVYSSIDTSSTQKKAIKIIPLGNKEEYELLKTEFDISLSLKHKNIIKTDYYDEFKNKGTTYIYCVMDFYENGNLRDFLSSQSKDIATINALKLMLDIAHGLEYAHTKVVHRDLKPENILLDKDQNLLICDFGLAKYIDSKTRTHTFKGFGTLPYMSPECWMFDSNTPLMDIYSLGILFYELVTLKMPFTGNSEHEFRDKHLYEQLPNISNSRVNLPHRLIEMINKMTNKRPQDRYASVSNVVEILNELSQNLEKEEDSKMDKLLEKANQKVSINQQQDLQRQRQQELIDTKQKFIDFSINSLFDDFNKRIIELNQSLERAKIKEVRTANQLTVKFMEKSFSILFYPYSDIQATLIRRKDTILQNQQRQYGFVFNNPQPTFIENDNVILIGQMTIDNYSYSTEVWGYNLLLRKANPEDLYGEWWVVWFDDSGLSRKYPQNYHYAIGIPEFYQEYEFGRSHTIHVRTMGTNSLKSEGIDKMIEKLFE